MLLFTRMVSVEALGIYAIWQAVIYIAIVPATARHSWMAFRHRDAAAGKGWGERTPDRGCACANGPGCRRPAGPACPADVVDSIAMVGDGAWPTRDAPMPDRGVRKGVLQLFTISLAS